MLNDRVECRDGNESPRENEIRCNTLKAMGDKGPGQTHYLHVSPGRRNPLFASGGQDAWLAIESGSLGLDWSCSRCELTRIVAKRQSAITRRVLAALGASWADSQVNALLGVEVFVGTQRSRLQLVASGRRIRQHRRRGVRRVGGLSGSSLLRLGILHRRP